MLVIAIPQHRTACISGSVAIVSGLPLQGILKQMGANE